MCRSCRSQCRSSQPAESRSASSSSMPTCGPRSTASGLRRGRAKTLYVVDGKGNYLVHPDRAPRIRLAAGHADQMAKRLPRSGSLGWRDAKRRARPAGTGRTPERHRARAGAPRRQRMGRGHPARTERRLHGAGGGDPEQLILVGLIAVLCAAALAVLIARSLTRPIVQLTAAVEGAGRDGHGRHSGRCRRRDRRAGARICAGDGGSERKDRRARTRGRRASPHRSRARPPCRARAPVQRGRRILQRRHHHAYRSTARSPAGIRPPNACSATPRRKRWARTSTSIVPADRRTEVRGHPAPDRLGRDGSSTTKPCACARTAARSRSRSAFPRSGRRRARSSAYPRPPATLPKRNRTRAGAAAADRGAAPHLRDLAGSDPGDGFARAFWSRSARVAQAILGYRAGGDDRPQRRRIHPPRRSRERPRGNARRAARRTPEDCRHALHPQGRADGDGCPGWAHGRNRSGGTSSSAAT